MPACTTAVFRRCILLSHFRNYSPCVRIRIRWVTLSAFDVPFHRSSFQVSLRQVQASIHSFWVPLWFPTRMRDCRTEIDFFIPCRAYIGPAAWQTPFHKLSLALLRTTGGPQRVELWNSFPITQFVPRDSLSLACEIVRNATPDFNLILLYDEGP